MDTIDDFVEFLADIRHDLCGPLTQVVGFAELLLDKYSDKLNSELSARLKVVGENAKELATVMTRTQTIQHLHPRISIDLPDLPQDLADTEKAVEYMRHILAGQKKYKQAISSIFTLGPFNVKRYVYSWCEIFSDKDIELVYGICPENLILPRKYTPIFLNIFSNVLSHAADDCSEVVVRNYDDESDCTIAIENDGSNVLNPEKLYQRALELNLVDPKEKFTIEDKLQLIFREGFSSSYGYSEGSISIGRGLYTIKKKIENNGGEIKVVSPVRKDTINKRGITIKEDGVGFYFTIPEDKIIDWR